MPTGRREQISLVPPVSPRYRDGQKGIRNHVSTKPIKSCVAFGYGLIRKPRIFKSRGQPKQRAHSGAAWSILWMGASRCL